MRTFLLSLAGVCALMVDTGIAAEPSHELAPKEAVRLIAMMSNARENSIEIPFIIEGSAGCGKNFEARHVRRVAAIHPVRDGNSQSRQLVFYNLFWNESLGWFAWESRSERTGDVVYIWSETKGLIVNK